MYVITGSDGFLGRAIQKRLEEKGEEVIGLDNQSRHGKRPFKGIPFDCRKPLPNIKCRAVIHLAAINGTANFYERPYEVLETGCLSVFQAVELARKNNARLFVASSSEVYQADFPADERIGLGIPDVSNPRFSYAASKIVTEVAALNSGLEATVFRPHNVYGPDAGDKHVIPQFMARAKDCDGVFELDGGSQTRAFTWIDDFVDGFMCLLDAEPGIYHIGSEEEVTIRDLAERILRLHGKKAVFKENAMARGGPNRRCPDISKLKALGFKPKVTLDEGLRKLHELSGLRPSC